MERMFVNGTNMPILSLLLLIGGLATIQIPRQKWSITKTGSAEDQCATELWECK